MEPHKLNTIYIISKGRPQCRTARFLTKINYPGPWFIVCGNNDETIPKYKETWGEDRILVFDWFSEIKESDLLDNFGFEKMSSGAVPVRNATRKMSAERGEVRHWQFDDDYNGFYLIDPKRLKNVRIKDGRVLEQVLLKIATFGYKANLVNVGFSIAHETFPKDWKSFSKRVFNAHNLPSDESLFLKWKGRMNDDLINALEAYHFGKQEFSFKLLSLVMPPTQSEKGGNTDIYEDIGTVRKTAYAILVEPKATKLIIKYGRYHHKVEWEQIIPKMIKASFA